VDIHSIINVSPATIISGYSKERSRNFCYEKQGSHATNNVVHFVSRSNCSCVYQAFSYFWRIARIPSFPGNYKIFLHEDGDIIAEEVAFPPIDYDLDDTLEEYPKTDVPGYENPFKNLDHNPTLEI